MRVLLTGANGFLGRYALDSLQRRGIGVIMLGRQRAPDSDADFIEADLLATPDFAALLKEAKASHLLHLAWYAEHGKYWASPLNLRWVEATTRLIEAFCEADGQQVVAAGTCAEYDWSYGYCREESTPLNPATLYGTAKDAARRLAMEVCAQHRVPCAWGRVFLPFGTGEASQRLIPSLIEVFRGRRPPFGINAPAYRDFLHASDVAEGFIALLHSGSSGAYNISSGQPVQLADMVRELAQLLGADPQAVLDLTTDRPGEPPLLVGENLKLKTLGWQPALSLAQGLKQTVREAKS
ncbi:MAG: NAD-dependent epimerase [Gallionellales bacterium RIFCSPLOWO2_12_FULL_59_22]|nr:MAG: NAD-dependent epimerase [Gallionellales bacterium RIFCSPLOWO2_12_FULL_59_22]